MIIRAWAEPEGLRSRVTLARPLEPLAEETLTVAGLDAVLAQVSQFLAGVADAG